MTFFAAGPEGLPISLWTGILLTAGAYFFVQLLLWLKWNYLDGIPVVGPSQSRSLFDRSVSWKKLVTSSYNQYSKHGQPFRMMGQTIIPVSTFVDYRRAPLKTLDTSAIIDQSLNFHLWLGKDHLDVVNFIKQNVIRNIPNMIEPIIEEVGLMYRTQWSPEHPRNSAWTDDNGVRWDRVQIYPAILKGVGRISARMLVGKKYAQNPEWTDTASAYAGGVMKSALIFRQCPTILKPWLADLVPTAGRIKKLKSIVREDVLTYIKDDAKGDEGAEDPTVELTFLRLMVKYVQALPDYKDASPEKILQGTLGRLISGMFATIDTTTMTSTHVIYDLTSNPYEEYAGPIKQEIDEVLARNGGKWSQGALNQLPHLDSFIKESQRLHAISVTLSARYVTTPEGYTLKATEGSGAKNVHCSQGTLLSMPLWAVHTDPSIYQDPMVFRGFRFANDSAPSSQPSDKFMAFGHGKHACPGRLLALCVVKLLVIEFLSRYNFKANEKRPEDIHLMSMVMPNKTAFVDLHDKTNN